MALRRQALHRAHSPRNAFRPRRAVFFRRARGAGRATGPLGSATVVRRWRRGDPAVFGGRLDRRHDPVDRAALARPRRRALWSRGAGAAAGVEDEQLVRVGLGPALLWSSLGRTRLTARS